METVALERQLAEAEATIRALQQELAETNHGLVALSMELEQRVEERTAQLADSNRALRSEIGQRNLAEAALRESEWKYRTLFEHMAEGVAYCRMLYDEEGRPHDFLYLDVNAAFGRLTGLQDVVGRRLTEVIPDIREKHPELFELYGRIARGSGPEKFDIHFSPLDQWLSLSVFSPASDHFIAVFENITERKRIEEKLAWLASFPERHPIPIVEVDRAGRVHYLNAAAKRLFPDLEQKGLAHAWLADWEAVIGLAQANGTYERVVSLGRNAYQQSMYYVGGADRVRIYGTDISERILVEEERRTLQTELLHVSRLSAMGQMAAALAHELNQPLTALAVYVGACTRLLEGDLDDDRRSKLQQLLSSMSHEALRAGEIIRRIREFVHKGDTVKKLERAATVMHEASTLALTAAKHQGVDVHVDVDAPGQILVNKVQIQQVVFNLVRNAIEAMETSSRKELTIGLRELNGEMEVSIADTGVGLAPEIIDRLFMPFSSTKASGMGIGLSVCRNIIEAHDGRIWAEPNPEGGTIFRFVLPTVTNAAAG